MAFQPIKLRPEAGANVIKNVSDAHAFMMHMNLALRNKPHWQVVAQTLTQAFTSEEAELLAWLAFRNAAHTEGWLIT